MVHTPEILGNDMFVSKKTVGGNSFDSSSNESETWDDPAVLPADMSLGISTSQSEAWTTSGAAELWAEPAVLPSDLSLGISKS